MKFQDWIWVYLGVGETFTRWAAFAVLRSILCTWTRRRCFGVGACSRYGDSPITSMLRRSVCPASEKSLRRLRRM